MNKYYSTKLKLKRLKILNKEKNFKFYKVDLVNKKVEDIFKKNNFDLVLNFAAQAGVRYSMKIQNHTQILI